MFLALVPLPARAQGSLIPPVDGALSERFDAPAGPYSPGHRGVDYSVPTGTPVRAAAAATVRFAGSVAGDLFVTILHPGGIETTYSQLGELEVKAGQTVAQGTWLGKVSRAHEGVTGLHFGVRFGDDYVDPLTLMGWIDVGEAIHLAPLIWEPSQHVPSPLAAALAPTTAGSHERSCREAVPRLVPVVPPNDNVAVAVAGIGSKTRGGVSADMYEPGPERLGYPAGRVYRFSYAGPAGARLHRPYERTDTYGDIDGAARRLKAMLKAVARKHPGRDVDLLAHSQGGIVARTYLTRTADAFEPGLPRVEHLVTFSSPHSGAPAAGEVDELASGATGRWLLREASERSARGSPLPDPLSPAVMDLGPGSEHMAALERQDILFGTRVLSLGIPNDVIVPADRTRVPYESHRIVQPAGVNGHSAVVSSAHARGIAYDFLRGAGVSCPGPWDTWGRHLGRAISWTEAKLGDAYRLGRIVGLPWPR